MTQRKIHDAAKMALVRALIWDARVACLDRWVGETTRGPHEKRPDYSALRAVMTDRALDGWRDAMMWGLLDDELRGPIRKEAANRFLRMDGSIKSSVMHHLNRWGDSPGQWSGEVEEQFRAEIRLALAEEPDESDP